MRNSEALLIVTVELISMKPKDNDSVRANNSDTGYPLLNKPITLCNANQHIQLGVSYTYPMRTFEGSD